MISSGHHFNLNLVDYQMSVSTLQFLWPTCITGIRVFHVIIFCSQPHSHRRLLSPLQITNMSCCTLVRSLPDSTRLAANHQSTLLVQHSVAMELLDSSEQLPTPAKNNRQLVELPTLVSCLAMEFRSIVLVCLQGH